MAVGRGDIILIVPWESFISVSSCDNRSVESSKNVPMLRTTEQ